ncbi:RNA export factor [Saccharomycopsis crataegensis]|uniref:RNA export factor n=1 Tax=Saccharomycopsis crataegensis TaxID=43959 RepID=A0AAV5QU94_9ASCO|nr:RNA export factor [Saccharomycopsis crataegensis]
MSFGRTASSTTTPPLNDIDLANPPEDTVSDLAFSSQGEFLSVSSWDSKVRVYQIMGDGSSQGKAMYEHQGPVLSTRWTGDGTKIVSGGCDKAVKLYDVASGQSTQIGAHNEPVSVVRFAECGNSNTPVIVSGSWDKTLKYWDMRSPNPVSTIELPERCYVMDTRRKLLVCGTAEKKFVIINLDNPTVKFKETTSPLKWQTKSISCFVEGDGYAVGSIEGRLSVQYVSDENQKKAFSFKCHRENVTDRGRTKNRLYSLNQICFHPVQGTFVTAGSEGNLSFWDKDSKHRLKSYQSIGTPITAANFNNNGSIFAYAIGYDWSKGYTYSKPDNPVGIKIHAVKDEEVKRKS